MSESTQPTQFTIHDLLLTKDVIEVASSRGAFKANELSAVGELYNRLTAFLAAALPAKTETTDETEAVSDAEPVAEDSTETI